MLDKTLRGRYQIIRLLGSGGFGATFIAEDRDLPGNPLCVVKQLKSKDIEPSVWQTARRLFETEAQVLYRLGKHDRIPQLLAHFEENQEFYLVQEFIDGEDLSQILTPGNKMSEAEMINFLQYVLETLEFVHQQNVIHRDIKPSNLIKRQKDGKFVLIDFGAVKEIGTLVGSSSGETSGTILIGSSGYMPSEQLRGKPRFSSDIYALGMTAIQALTGVLPEELEEDPETGEFKWQEYAQVSNNLVAIVDKMVRSHFKDRYPSASEVLTDLRNLQNYTNASTHLLARERVGKNLFFKYYHVSILLITVLAIILINKIFQATLTVSKPSNALVSPSPSPHISAAADMLTQGKTLLELRRYQEAFETLEKATQVDKNYPQVWVDRGEALENLQRYEDALKSYDEALKIQPDYSSAWYHRGFVLQQLKRYEEALRSLDKSLEIQPNYPEAWYIRGIVLDELQNDLEAVDSLNKAVELHPNYGEAWYKLGIILNKLKRYKEAMSALERAVQFKPVYVEAWVERGSTLGNLRQYKEALTSFDRALEIKPDSPEAWGGRGEVLTKLKRYEEALASLEKAVQLKQDYAEAWYNRGIVLEELENYDLAIASFDKAAQVKPDYSDAWYRRGVVLEKMQKDDDAIASYDKAIQIWPANREAIENRKNLLTKAKR